MGKASSSKAKAMKATLKKAPSVKSLKKDSTKTVDKKALLGLGKMTLEEKVRAAIESSHSEEAAAAELKRTLSKIEHSKIWNQHQTHLKNNPHEAQDDPEKPLAKREKGMAVALWFVKQCKPKFMSMQMSM